jgi:hypothetical protein
VNVEQIKQEIRQLSNDEMIEIRTMIDSLLAMSGIQTKQPNKQAKNHEERLVLETICGLMQSKGLASLTVPILLRSPYMKPFREKLPLLLAFLARAHPEHLGQKRVLEIGVECLYDNLKAMNVAVSEITLLRHIHRLPAVIDQQFPGYAQNGLLRLVVNDRPSKQKRFDPLAKVG